MRYLGVLGRQASAGIIVGLSAVIYSISYGALLFSGPLAVYVGFGIKDPETAQDCARFADGVIVGSALVSALSVCKTPEQCATAAVAFLAPIRQAIDLV